MEWEKDLKDPQEFMDALKEDVFNSQVYVFTPKGDVIELPAESTPIDFAYRVHTNVGNKCVGAKIDGRIVPIDYKLQNGNIVEVLTSSNSNGPSRDWLNIVKTPNAKSRIRQFFKKERREENVDRGNTKVKDLYLKEVKKAKKEQQIQEEDLNKHNISETEYSKKRKKNASQGIIVKGLDNILVRFAKCCNPLPGDEIVGYITKGRGVAIHRADCPNANNNGDFFQNRLVEVSWSSAGKGKFEAEIQIKAIDRRGIVNEITHIE